MVEKSRRDRVGLGLIGLGPSWEQVYREALERLQNRLTVRLVYDPVEARARSVAGEFDAEVVSSLHQIITRDTLQGLLVLEPGWCAIGAIRLISRSSLPTFLGRPMLKFASEWTSGFLPQDTSPQSVGRSPKADDQLMPELGLRFTPSSCRLRELIATKLGRVRHLMIECDLSAKIGEIASVVDWCSNIMEQEPAVSTRPTKDTLSELSFDLNFLSSPSSHSSLNGTRTAKFRHHSTNDSSMKIEVECDRGHATLANRTQIFWKTSSETANESLTEERSETEILIDQFCRRALGGLIPVCQLSDFTNAIKIVESLMGVR